ncbi:hypothetical protein EP10_001994 [Geobacillus icigianus]|uniref:Uncharacterized protein n=1 Tax=Geobacillus icigianus TaxID=1430331 RepID=A0ABU6BGU2_9BACL|nr:hypothetical protein [Geobacillus icigianus]
MFVGERSSPSIQKEEDFLRWGGGSKQKDAKRTLFLAKVKHVVRDDTMKTIFHTIYHQVIKAPFAETARLFKKQWDELVKSVASVS